MLNSASDYRCLDMTGMKGFISGNPLPKRDKRGDGSWRALKYEDLLFLAEGELERTHWDSKDFGYGEGGATKGRLRPRRMNGLNFYGTNDTSRLLLHLLTSDNIPGSSSDPYNSKFIDPDIALPAANTLIPVANGGDYAGAFGQSTVIRRWKPGITTGVGASKPSRKGFPLNGKALRKCFWNMSRLKRTLTTHSPIGYYGGLPMMSSVKVVSQYCKGGDDPGDKYENEIVLNPASMPSELYFFGGTSRLGTGFVWATYTSAGGNIAEFPAAKSATLLFMVTTWNEGVGSNRYFVYPVTCSVTDGKIANPGTGMLNGIRDSACSAAGIPYLTTAKYMHGAAGGVAITGAALVVDHEFPAETDSLEWGWEPN